MEPANLFIASKPRELTFGKSARISFHQKHGFFQSHLTLKKPSNVLVAHASKRFQSKAITFLTKILHLINQSVFDHSVTTLIDQIIQLRTLPVEPDLQRLKRALTETVLFLPFAHRPAGQLINFQGTNDPLPVIRMNPRRC